MLLNAYSRELERRRLAAGAAGFNLPSHGELESIYPCGINEPTFILQWKRRNCRMNRMMKASTILVPLLRMRRTCGLHLLVPKGPRQRTISTGRRLRARLQISRLTYLKHQNSVCQLTKPRRRLYFHEAALRRLIRSRLSGFAMTPSQNAQNASGALHFCSVK